MIERLWDELLSCSEKLINLLTVPRYMEVYGILIDSLK